jgi:hypothetical protein
MLSDHGMSAERKLYKPADIHSIAYVEHDLQVNALVLDLAHRARAGEGPLLDEMPFAWHGPRRGEIDPREEQRPEGESETRARMLPRFFHGGSREGVIKPDATLILGGQSRARRCSLSTTAPNVPTSRSTACAAMTGF